MTVKIILIILINTIYSCTSEGQNTDSFFYEPFYPIEFQFEQYNAHLTANDSIYLQKFLRYLIDSSTFISNGYFVIQTFSTRNEIEKDSCIDFVRFLNIKNYMMFLIDSLKPFPKLTPFVYIFGKTFLNSYTPLLNKNPYCQISLNLLPNYNRDSLLLKNKH